MRNAKKDLADDESTDLTSQEKDEIFAQSVQFRAAMNKGYASLSEQLQESIVVKLGLKLVGRRRICLKKISKRAEEVEKLIKVLKQQAVDFEEDSK